MKTNTFTTDEGSLTGESAGVSKTTDPVIVSATLSAKTNMVFSGTLVTGGACYAVVVGTGGATEIGMINAGVQAAKEDHTKTPLAQKLDEFGAQLTKLIGGICVLVWVMSMSKFNNPIFSSWAQGAVYYAKTAVALGVAAIPEGLPAVITLCLSLGTRRMAKRNVIVRKLSSVETLGTYTNYKLFAL
jgi:P-type E1-E2 ATPase